MAKKSPAEKLALAQISEELLLMRGLVARLNLKLHDINCVAQQLSDLLSALIAARVRGDHAAVEALLDEIIRDHTIIRPAGSAGKPVH